MAHFGRPKGKVVPEMSLRPLVPALSEAFGVEVRFADGDYAAAADALGEGDVLLLENVRFHPKARRRTTRPSRSGWRISATSTATTPSARRTGRTPPPMPSRSCCRPAPGG